jgi:hypothetical protein
MGLLANCESSSRPAKERAVGAELQQTQPEKERTSYLNGHGACGLDCNPPT